MAPVAVRPAVAFEEGDEVTVPGPKKGAPRLTGLITEMLAKHAWVTLAVGQGPKSGQRNRVALKAIKAVEQPAPVTTAAATAAASGGDGSGGQAPAAAAASNDADDADDAVDTTTASEAAWASAADVFGSLNFAE